MWKINLISNLNYGLDQIVPARSMKIKIGPGSTLELLVILNISYTFKLTKKTKILQIIFTGGLPNQVVKFNVMNLNKQAKLFSQGMQPVMKIGANGKWERIKDKANFGV